MKKILCILMTLCFLIGSLSVFAVTAGAEETELTGKLNVTHVSAADNGEVNWYKLWDTSNEERIGYQYDNAVEVIGRFDAPTKVTNIVLNSVYWHTRLNGITVSLSQDGNTWTEALAIKGQSGSSSYRLSYFDLDGGDTKYSFIKLAQNTATGGKYQFDLRWVAVYNADSKGMINVEHVSNYGSADASNVWDFDNSTDIVIGGAGSGVAMVTGKFELPTVIETVYINLHKNYQARNNATSVEASADGETWTEIAKLSTNVVSSDTVTGYGIVPLEVTDTTAYSYIRVVKNNTYTWSISSVGVEGTEHPELVERIIPSGFQISDVADGKYSLRVVAVAKASNLEDVKLKLDIGAQNGQEWTFDVPANKFETITANTAEGAVTINPADKDGTVFYTAVIEGIPENVGLFSVTVTPNYKYDGKVIMQTAKTIVMNNTEVKNSATTALETVKDNIKISGRSYELEKGIACDFTASGIEFNAVLAGDVKLKVECSATTYYTLYLNGEKQDRLKFNAGTAEYVIAKSLPAKEYNVKLVKQTHVAHSISALLDITMAGSFLDKPADNNLLIEFIGDSITCGYGTVGYPTSGVTYYGTSDYCDSTLAYAYKTATALKADYSMISVSGWAVLPEGENGGGCIPEIYGKTSYNRGDTLYTPSKSADIVVINLGTNDISSRTNFETDFVSAYAAFIGEVMEMNPDAKIVLAYGMMHTGDKLEKMEAKINEVLTTVGGAEFGVYAVKLTCNTDAGNGHPSDEGHTVAAEELTQFINNTVLN